MKAHNDIIDELERPSTQLVVGGGLRMWTMASIARTSTCHALAPGDPGVDCCQSPQRRVFTALDDVLNAPDNLANPWPCHPVDHVLVKRHTCWDAA